jgi:hypothetical protein|tara:strand:- start:337 stop:795 length:459 start_codon:yes stop_codon:yes gene_type:complete
MSNLTTFDPNEDNENLFLQAQKSLQESQLSLFKIVKKIDNDNKVRDKKVESIEQAINYINEDNRARKANQGRVTANSVAKILGLPTDTSVTRPIGMELRNISLRHRISIGTTDADTNAVYSTVNTYHPYVAKIYIEQKGYPVPPQFQYISKP